MVTDVHANQRGDSSTGQSRMDPLTTYSLSCREETCKHKLSTCLFMYTCLTDQWSKNTVKIKEIMFLQLIQRQSGVEYTNLMSIPLETR
jgi:hypothetical protein